VRFLSPANRDALAAGRLVARDFLWIVARERDTGDPAAVGFWSDVDDLGDARVINPDTGLEVSRAYKGAGGLVEIDAIPAVSMIEVQDVNIRLSQLDAAVEQAVRLYDVKQARVEIHRGLYDPESRLQVAPAYVRFVGFVNNVTILTPAEGRDGGVNLTCVSHTQELMRSNPATRSHEDQINNRSTSDNFLADTAVAFEWEIDWGAVQGSQNVDTRKGLFGWGNFLGFL